MCKELVLNINEYMYLFRIKTYRKITLLNKADCLAAKALKLFSNNIKLLNEYVVIAENAKNWPETIVRLKHLLTIDNDEQNRITAYKRLIHALGANHQYEEAEQLAYQLIDLELHKEYPQISEKKFTHFVSWDAELGWAPLANARKPDGLVSGRRSAYFTTDERGSRLPWPDYTNTKLTISAYGDSYCMCREVEDNETWPWYLAQRNNCYVSNYGVGNYGLDQAILRLERNYDNDPTDVVILAVTTYACQRMTSIFKHYVENGNILGVKPRFYLDDKGELQVFKNPLKNREDLLNLHQLKELIRANDAHYQYWRDIQLQKLMPWKEKPMNMTAYNNQCWTEYKDLFVAAIKRFEQFSVQKKFKPVFLLLYPGEQLPLYAHNPGPWVPVLEEIKSSCPSVQVVDSLGWFSNHKPWRKLYTRRKLSGHTTALANRLIATHLDEALSFNKNTLDTIK